MTQEVDCCIAFLDLWGFSADVRERDPTEIINVLEEVRQRLEKRRAELSWFYMFSDSVVLVQATSEGKGGWNRFIAAMADVQTAAVDNGFLFRGAITAGPMRCAENICFGVPFLEAYALEQQLALPVVMMTHKASERTGFKLGKVAEVPIKDEREPTAVLRATVSTVRFETLKRMALDRREQLITTNAKVAATWARLADFVDRHL